MEISLINYEYMKLHRFLIFLEGVYVDKSTIIRYNYYLV